MMKHAPLALFIVTLFFIGTLAVMSRYPYADGPVIWVDGTAAAGPINSEIRAIRVGVDSPERAKVRMALDQRIRSDSATIENLLKQTADNPEAADAEQRTELFDRQQDEVKTLAQEVTDLQAEVAAYRSLNNELVLKTGDPTDGPRKWELYMPMIVSIVLLGLGIMMIYSRKFDSDSLKWAYGVVGAIMGYWLKTI